MAEILQMTFLNCTFLTHWGRVTHICVSKLTIIGSDNGLWPGRRQTIIWTNDGILLIKPLGTNFSEILSEIHTFSFKKMHLKTSSAKWRPFCLGLNVLIAQVCYHYDWNLFLRVKLKRSQHWLRQWLGAYVDPSSATPGLDVLKIHVQLCHSSQLCHFCGCRCPGTTVLGRQQAQNWL